MRLNYRKCGVPNCNRRYDLNPELKFHCFPNTERCFIWLDKIKNSKLRNTPLNSVKKCYSICDRHFDDSQFQTPQRLKLNRNAIPTLYLPDNDDEQAQTCTGPETNIQLIENNAIGGNFDAEVEVVQEHVVESKSTQSTLEEEVDAPTTSQMQVQLAAKTPKSIPTIIRTPRARKKRVKCTQSTLQKHLDAPGTSQVQQQPIENAKNNQCGSVDQKMEGLTVSQFDKTCRACLSQPEELLPIFEVTYENVQLWEIFRTCLHIEIEKDSTLPQHICKSCTGHLVQVYAFNQQCQQSNDILRTILIKHSKSIQLPCDNKKKQINQESFNFNIEIEDHSYAELLDNELLDDIENVQEENDTLNEENSLLKAFIKKGNEGEQSSYNNKEEKNDQKSCGFENNDVIEHEDLVEENQTINEGKKKKKSKFCCNYCNKFFDSSYEFKLHREKENHPVPRDQKCLECGKMYSKSGLKQHMVTHKEERPFVCHICGSSFRFRRSFLRHMMIHTGEKPHMCEICGKCFSQARVLKQHKWIHTGERPYLCSCCGRGFRQLSKLRYHLTLHFLKSNDSKTEEDTTTELHELYVFECEICLKRFISKDVLDTHQQVHRKKSFPCNHCGKSFASNARLLFHMKTHTRDTDTRYTHTRDTHPREKVCKLYKCSVCYKTFTQSGAVKVHMLIHTGEKPFPCKLCPKKFVQRSQLEYHMLTHSGERPHACMYCDKTFALKGNMIAHSRIHTGETPFICGVCGKGFYTSSSMKKHRRTHVNSKNNDEYLSSE